TGAPVGFYGDVVACAKKDLKAGDILDGEGGYLAWGKLVSAKTSTAQGWLPMGLAHQVRLTTDTAAGEIIRAADVEFGPQFSQILSLRKETASLLGEAT
ncbi:MAG: hypothetical protein LBG11_09065, partial [Bifidobacteriaceae bacterium]|nr:hypothetical protein [Bifidobacteriaceae bacterium]